MKSKEAPQTTAEPVPQVEALYNCVSVISGGYALDPSMLGGGSSFVLRSDGSVTFTMSGERLTGLTWHTDGATGRSVIDYYDDTELVLAPAENGGFQFDYLGVMTMVFEKAG